MGHITSTIGLLFNMFWVTLSDMLIRYITIITYAALSRLNFNILTTNIAIKEVMQRATISRY